MSMQMGDRESGFAAVTSRNGQIQRASLGLEMNGSVPVQVQVWTGTEY